MDKPPDAPKSTKTVFQIPASILDDLCSRFLINIPEEERHDLIRVFFQIELAHWFYLDFYCEENSELKACGIKDFSAQIFHHCPTLTEHADNVDSILDTWREYKMAVPTFGAIIMDTSLQYCLLVQGFWSKTNWGFPKGKVNEEEVPVDCAIREVFEETGYDISPLMNPNHFIEYKINEQLARLYLITNVPMETKFAPRTRKEIKKLEWFKIDTLPAHKKDMTCKQHYGLSPNAFFMVIPFIKQLKKWIARKLGKSSNEVGDSDQGTPGSYKGKPRDPAAATSDKTKAKNSAKKPSKGKGTSQEGPKATTDQQRQKQQASFAQQMQNEFQEYMGSTGDGQGWNDGRSAAQYQGQQAAQGPFTSPGSAGKKVQILKRDRNESGGGFKRSLAGQFTEDEHSPRREGSTESQPTKQFFSVTWDSFKLDADSILNSMNMYPQTRSKRKQHTQQQ